MMKELMNRKTNRTSHPENGAKKIGPKTKMRLFPKDFQGMFLGLKNCFVSFFSKIITQNLNFLGNNFYILSTALAFYHLAYNFQRRSSRNIFDQVFAKILKIDYNLKIVNSGAIIQCNKPIRTECANPSLNRNIVV